MELVKVDWVDAHNPGGWHSPQEIDKLRVLPCVTVGYLMKLTDDEVVTAACRTLGDDPVYSLVDVIPRQWVTDITPLILEPPIEPIDIETIRRDYSSGSTSDQNQDS